MKYDLLVSADVENFWVINAKLNKKLKVLEGGLILFYANQPPFLKLKDSEKNILVCVIELPEEFISVKNSGSTKDFSFKVTEFLI